MMANRQLGWRKLFLILTVLPCCSSLQVSMSHKYEVARGGDITMTCSFKPAKEVTAIVLTWSAEAENQEMKTVATYFAANQIDITPSYEGRASLHLDLMTHESTLTLTKVTMQDSRRFQCTVLIPNDDEGNTVAATFLLVLVPPSPPICRIQGKAEYGHNVSLTCVSEEGSPPPTYGWTRFSVENTPRELPPTANQKDGVLSLFNISKELSGFYICLSRNQISSASCNFTLAVMPASMTEASIPIIVGGVLAGLLCLGILIFCCCRKKAKKDKYAEGAPGEMEFYDKDSPEAGVQYFDDSETKQHKQDEAKDVVPQNYLSVGTAGKKFEDDQLSHGNGKERNDAKDSDTDSQRYRDNPHDHYVGSCDRPDDQHDCPDDQRDRHGGSREHLDDQRNRYVGSRDRLDNQRDRYGGSREHLDDQPDRYVGSRDRLDDQRNRYVGSRDRLDDQRDRYGGSREHLDDRRDPYRGSREHLDDRRDPYRGSREHLDDRRDPYRGSREHLDDRRDPYRGSREHLDDRRDRYKANPNPPHLF